MIAELGHFALILAWLASALGVATLFSSHTALVQLAPRATYAAFALVALSFAALTTCFVQSDFTVALVVGNSHTLKPLLYKFSGVWGNHEGSLLLWVLVLTLCAALVAAFERRLTGVQYAAVLGVLSLITFCFIGLSLLTSNPFTRIWPPAADGQDLNPLLQDPGLAFHPPLLYIGYVGSAVAFAIVVAALLGRQTDVRAFAGVLRTWALFAWAFLTAGLALGSWWAYYELGWGGWWFWDPVENAALVPWLVGTALLHSVRVLQARGALARWTVLLAILTFALGVLGTFLVRSGVLTSVHAFASDPTRGIAILAVFAFLVGGAFVLLSLRWPQLAGSTAMHPISREGALLINNILLAVAAATVLIGTLYPLIIDALGLPAITVGPPYYNATFVPLMLPLLVLVGAGQALAWGDTQDSRLQRRLLLCSGAVALLVLAVAAYYIVDVLPVVGFAVGALVIVSSVLDFRHVAQVSAQPARFAGKALAHIGLGVLVLGVAGSALGTEKIIKVRPGDQVSFAGYELQYQNFLEMPGPNYVAEIGTLQARRGDDFAITLSPERRYYPVADQMTTEAAIHTTWRGDLFATIGAAQPNGSKTLRLRWNPLQVWIWIGAVLMALGGLLAMRRPT